MTYLIDTNVISEARKRAANPHVLAWFASVSSADLYISVLTVGEIRTGIDRLRRKDADQAKVLEQWLDGLRANYSDRIVGIDTRIADEWGKLNCPDPVPVIDGLLAATAKCRGWTLVTRNTADLSTCDVALLNPFGPPSRL